MGAGILENDRVTVSRHMKMGHIILEIGSRGILKDKVSFGSQMAISTRELGRMDYKQGLELRYIQMGHGNQDFLKEESSLSMKTAIDHEYFKNVLFR